MKTDILESKFAAHEELFGNKRQKDVEAEQKALRSFKEKRELELQRRLRAIDYEKQKIIREIEKAIADKIKDYEELLRRKREEEQLLDDWKNKIRVMIDRQKKLMKDRMGTIGDEDRERIINEFEAGFKSLSGTVEMERKRQFLLMQEKRKKRRVAREKMYGEQEMLEIADERGYNILNSKILMMDNNTQMSSMLNQWQKKTEEKLIFQKKMEETARL